MHNNHEELLHNNYDMNLLQDNYEIGLFNRIYNIIDCVIQENIARYGGGLYLDDSTSKTPTFGPNCSFINNVATAFGGAILFNRYYSEVCCFFIVFDILIDYLVFFSSLLLLVVYLFQSLLFGFLFLLCF